MLTYCFSVAPFSATCCCPGNFIPGNWPPGKEAYLFVILPKPAVAVEVETRGANDRRDIRPSPFKDELACNERRAPSISRLRDQRERERESVNAKAGSAPRLIWDLVCAEKFREHCSRFQLRHSLLLFSVISLRARGQALLKCTLSVSNPNFAREKPVDHSFCPRSTATRARARGTFLARNPNSRVNFRV